MLCDWVEDLPKPHTSQFCNLACGRGANQPRNSQFLNLARWRVCLPTPTIHDVSTLQCGRGACAEFATCERFGFAPPPPSRSKVEHLQTRGGECGSGDQGFWANGDREAWGGGHTNLRARVSLAAAPREWACAKRGTSTIQTDQLHRTLQMGGGVKPTDLV